MRGRGLWAGVDVDPLASIASCIALSFAFVAKKRGIELHGLDLSVVGSYEGLRFERISASISSGASREVLGGLLPEAERVCYVSNTLRYPAYWTTPLSTSVTSGTPRGAALASGVNTAVKVAHGYFVGTRLRLLWQPLVETDSETVPHIDRGHGQQQANDLLLVELHGDVVPHPVGKSPRRKCE